MPASEHASAGFAQLRHASAGVALDEAGFVQLMRSQRFVPGETGRYWVALSLREAESLRGALHVAMDGGIALVDAGL